MKSQQNILLKTFSYLRNLSFIIWRTFEGVSELDYTCVIVSVISARNILYFFDRICPFEYIETTCLLKYLDWQSMPILTSHISTWVCVITLLGQMWKARAVLLLGNLVRDLKTHLVGTLKFCDSTILVFPCSFPKLVMAVSGQQLHPLLILCNMPSALDASKMRWTFKKIHRLMTLRKKC